MPEFQGLVQDRIEFALARYFYRKERGSPLGGKGYCGKMDVEVHNDEHFVAWTSVRYDDPSRFGSAGQLLEDGHHLKLGVICLD